MLKLIIERGEIMDFNGMIDSPVEFYKMDIDRRERLYVLCDNLFERKLYVNKKYSSYDLKLIVNTYMWCTNGEIKGALLALGYHSNDIEHVTNCHFNVSDNSKVFR